MVRSRSLLLLLAALASTVVAAEMADYKRGLDAIVSKVQANEDAAFPVEDVDTLVPEDSDESPSKMAAREVTTMLQEGKSEGACKKLADSLCNEVEQSVESRQREIQDLDDGSKCEAEGQGEVEVKRKAVVSTQAKYKEVTQQIEKLASVEVDFGSYTLSTLTRQRFCTGMEDNSEYKKAKQTARNAVDLARQVLSRFKSETTQYEKSLHSAAFKRWKCQCNVRSNYERAYGIATKGENKEANAYKKCNHMKCYLEERPAGQCIFDIPTVKGRKFDEYGVPKNECKAIYREDKVTSLEITKTVSIYYAESKGSIPPPAWDY